VRCRLKTVFPWDCDVFVGSVLALLYLRSSYTWLSIVRSLSTFIKLYV
jgi:hypothetical protein